MEDIARHTPYHARAARLAAVALLSLILLVPAPMAPAGAQQAAGLRVEVHNSTLAILVYPDGSIRPVYHLEASFYPVKGTGAEGTVNASYTTYYNGSLERHVLNATAQLAFSKPVENGSAVFRLNGSYSYSNGSGEAVASGGLVAVSGGSETRLGLEELRVTLSNASEILVDARLLLPSGSVDPGQLPPASQLNMLLAVQGISYLRVRELSASEQSDGRVLLHLALAIDADAMLESAAGMGLSAGDVAAIRDMLGSDISVNGSFSLNASEESRGASLRASLSYIDTHMGDLENASSIAARAAPALEHLVAVLAARAAAPYPGAPGAGIGAQLPVQIAPLPLGWLTALHELVSATPPGLVRAPGEAAVEARLALHMDRADLVLDYTGYRLHTANTTGSPARDASNALTAVSAAYTAAQPAIEQAGSVAPGIVPEEARLIPAGSEVSIHPSHAPLPELGSVVVVIGGESSQGQPSTTATPPATTTTTTTAPATTTTSTTATITTTTSTTAATTATPTTGSTTGTTTTAGATTTAAATGTPASTTLPAASSTPAATASPSPGGGHGRAAAYAAGGIAAAVGVALLLKWLLAAKP
ncbi:hypothetical protein CF15_07195 [Pyrodictium occultum]|uniref:Uncharacterized protein n=1 Tax=Pyrodictium occultum TaxID=2309 RepID=A0A0V8RWV0_PYROC|nr:hypothetical protein [Pyrodictium occultum]KSW12499.1 hypothetical protein CF15_07195 [Pyrodictium occultum]